MKGHFVFFPGAELVDGCGPKKKASANSRETVLLHSSEESHIPLYKPRYKRRRFGRSPSSGSLYCAVRRTHALCTPGHVARSAGQGLEKSGAVRPTLLAVAVPCRRDLAGVIRFRPTLIPHSWATWCVRPRRLRHRRHPLVRRGKSRPTSSPLCRTRTTTLVRHAGARGVRCRPRAGYRSAHASLAAVAPPIIPATSAAG